ncbi:MAG: TrmH family RNA methyltransferase, partial [Bacteroidaceae bacterium]
MISKQKIKFLRSLEHKKYRDIHNSFLAEGDKTISQLINHFSCDYLVATQEWLDANTHIDKLAKETDTLTPQQLSAAGLLKTPQNAIAVFKKKPATPPEPSVFTKQLCLVLDSIQDPGNLGTIIRLANWFGIQHIICSPTTADVYSPKVIQAAMGALAGISICYTDTTHYLSALPQDTPVYGTFLDGDNIYDVPLSSNGFIIMGNEGNGICDRVANFVTRRLYI